MCPIPDCDSYAVLNVQISENISIDTSNKSNSEKALNTEEIKIDVVLKSKLTNKNIEEENKSNFLICQNGHHFCKKCNLVSHIGFNCEKKLEKDFSLWAGKTFVKKCPKCKFVIEKNEGCNHMTCANKSCNYQFCWVCLGQFNDRHYTSVGSPCYGLQYSQSNILARFPCLRYIKCFLSIILAITLVCLAFILSTILMILYLYIKGRMIHNSISGYPFDLKKKIEMLFLIFVFFLSIPLLPIGWMICAVAIFLSPIILLTIWIRKRR